MRLTQCQWGQGEGLFEGTHLLSPALSSIGRRRGSFFVSGCAGLHAYSRKSDIFAKIFGRREIERSTSNIQRRASNAVRYDRLIGSWMFGVGCFAAVWFRLRRPGDIAPCLSETPRLSAFRDRQQCVQGNSFAERLLVAGRPEHLDTIRRGAIGQSEVERHAALRQIAGLPVVIS